MATIKCTTAQAKALYEARSLTGYDRKTKKSSILSQIKRDHGIASSTKLRINILNTDSDLYLVVRDKRTNKPLLNNLPDPVVAVAVQVPAEAPVAAPAVPAKQVPAKKAAPVKQAPVKKVAPVAKPLPVTKPTKKVAAKPLPVAKKAVKPVAKPVKQAPAAKPAKPLGSPTKSEKFCFEVRPSIDGKKVRLGYASSEAEKAKMIAAYKAANA